MKIRYLNREIEFNEIYRPDWIKVDGKSMSMEAYAAAHSGKNWMTSSGGNILLYRAEDGSEFAVPQGRFNIKKEVRV